MKYFTPKFYFKKVTPHSEKIIRKTKNFTPKNKTFTLNLIFFHKARKLLNETLNKFLHKIRSTLHQTDGTFGIPYIFIYLMNYQQPLSRFEHSHKKRKDSLETRAVLLIFSFELEISGVAVQSIHQTAKNGSFCEEMLSENDFEAVLATFYCYDHGADLSISNSEKSLVTGTPPT